jgi:hypothetical protein
VVAGLVRAVEHCVVRYYCLQSVVRFDDVTINPRVTCTQKESHQGPAADDGSSGDTGED